MNALFNNEVLRVVVYKLNKRLFQDGLSSIPAKMLLARGVGTNGADATWFGKVVHRMWVLLF